MEELSVPDSELPQRCATVNALFDNLVAILWDTAKSLHPTVPNVPRHRRQPRWWTDACYHALVARNAVWRDFRRSHLSEDYALFSSRRLYFHRLVCTSRRRFWRSWQDGVARLRMQDPRACASRIRRCFRLPDCRRTPHASMRWRSSSVRSARACDHWRTHFSSVTASGGYDDFSPDFSQSITRRFFDITADVSPRPFDALFSASELSNALRLCHDSAPGQDSLPYSAFQPRLPWWHHRLLKFFNLVLRWNVVPSSWKLSHVVPVFKHGDPAEPDHYRPISLASCAFKIFERLVHGRITPISDRLDECQGGFRWGADACVYGLLDTLQLREDMHTFCPFVDIRKAFDTSWVEATLVRLHQVGVTGGMWRTVANFFCGTLSQVRVCGDVSPPWVTRVLLRDVSSFQPIGQQPCSRHPTCFTWCPTRSTLRSPFHVSALR